MNNANFRSTMMALVGAYVLYTAYQLFDSMQKGESEMVPWLSIVFIVFFALAGVAVLYYAYVLWKRGKEGKDEEDPPKENEQSMK